MAEFMPMTMIWCITFSHFPGGYFSIKRGTRGYFLMGWEITPQVWLDFFGTPGFLGFKGPTFFLAGLTDGF